jgi:hypothetical protein
VKIELPPPLPEMDNNRAGLQKMRGGSASKSNLETPDNKRDFLTKPKSTENDKKLDEKSILLIQEFIAGLFKLIDMKMFCTCP